MESDSQVSESVIAGHTLSEQLGGGGFGTVWRARGPQGDVAIKILHAELIRSSDALGRFQREQEAIARVVHPNVVRSYGHGVLEDGRPYLILEMLRGPTLEDEITRRRGLPPGEVVAILNNLGEALDKAHANNIIHRDVKAGNVILAQGPQGPRPVLLDFGLAKLLDQEGPGLTNSRHMVGTPSAMSPEQLRGTPVDARTDVYSVGLLAYHMLTGERPFAGVPAIAQGYLLLHGARPRPSEKVPLDPAIDSVVMQAMAIEPSARFASVGEMVAALAHAVNPHREVGGPLRRALGVYLEISTRDATRRERCSGALVVLLRELGFVIAIEAPDSIIAASPDPSLRMATEVVKQVKDRSSGEAEVRIALGLVKAMFDDGNVDGEWIDVEGWAPYPLVDPVWIDPKLR